MQTFQKLGYSKKEAAQVTSLSLRSIDYLLAKGELQAVKVGKRVTAFTSSLQRLIEPDVDNRSIEISRETREGESR